VSPDKNQIKPAGILKLGYTGFNLQVQNKLICLKQGSGHQVNVHIKV